MVECESVVCWVGERIDMFGEREERLSETLCVEWGKMVFSEKRLFSFSPLK